MTLIPTTAPETIRRFLTAQFDKLARHHRQGNFRTRERYYKACKRFRKFPAVGFSNGTLSEKHALR